MNHVTFLIGHYLAMIFLYLKRFYYRDRFIFLLIGLALVMIVVAGFLKVKRGVESPPPQAPSPYVIPHS